MKRMLSTRRGNNRWKKDGGEKGKIKGGTRGVIQ